MRAISAFAAFALLFTPTAVRPQTSPAPPAASNQPQEMRCAATQPEMVTLRQVIGGRFQSRTEADRYVAYDDVANRRIWMFTTQAHPAHPSVACIEIVTRNGSIGADVRIRCFSAAANCADLNREFEERGARVRQTLAR